MAFLDNSGDIILDAVLTDTGRLRLAQGDGSFKITKFALGDDEINYGLYNKNHASGSAYYDLEILQTPVLEAFTNNTSNLKSRLLSISRTNILYMPTLKLNKREGTGGATGEDGDKPSFTYYRADNLDAAVKSSNAPSKFVVAVDQTTYEVLSENVTGSTPLRGVIQGYHPGDGLAVAGGAIRVDQGLATSAISPTAGLDSDLVETQYIMELDYRLGRVAQPRSPSVTDVNFIDDDNIASYYVAGSTYIRDNTQTDASADVTGSDPQVFDGPRGTTLMFRVRASTELQYSTYLFTQIGKTLSPGNETQTIYGLSDDSIKTSKAGANAKLYSIDSTIRVTGANTGFRIDVPVRYVKIQ